MAGLFRRWATPQAHSGKENQENGHFQQLVDSLDAVSSSQQNMQNQHWRTDVGNHNWSPRDVGEGLRTFAKQLDEAGDDQSSSAKHSARETVTQVLASGVLQRLVTSLECLDFEAQKLAMRAFGSALRLAARCGCDVDVAEFVLQRHPEICQTLLVGCGKSQVFSYCANMLRSCIEYPQLTEGLLSRFGAACHLIDLAGHQSFDIASEAFSCLRQLLLSHPDVSASYLQRSFSEFVGPYHELLLDDSNYVTQRQALGMLAEMLLNRSFKPVMIEYVKNEQFLQIHMNLLRNKSMSIKTEAFHVFKIFVVNPNKPPAVQKILRKNAERLLKVLETLGPKKEDDDSNNRSFQQDVQTVCGVLEAL